MIVCSIRFRVVWLVNFLLQWPNLVIYNLQAGKEILEELPNGYYEALYTSIVTF